MNIFKRIYCRIFQTALKIALPFLPYKNPEIIEKVEDIAGVIEKNGKKRPLIVTGKHLNAAGATKKLEAALAVSGYEYSLFDGSVSNPTSQTVDDALKIYKNDGCDCIIGFGGGSPMDCAKCVGALVARPKKTLWQMRGILKVNKKIPLLIAVPTTVGSGSETTLAAVVTDSRTRRKYAISDFPLIPPYAVLDGEVCETLPKHIISTTGMDALTHAVEAYIGRGGNRATRKDALEAANLIFSGLPGFYGGDKGAADSMLLAAHKAGRAFSKAYVGYVHATAHALGGKYDIAHGYANAVILPVVLREYGKCVHKKLHKMAVYCGIAPKNCSHGQGAEQFISRIEELNSAFGIGKTFEELRPEDIPELAFYAEKEANPLYPVPALWDRRKIENVYKKLLH